MSWIEAEAALTPSAVVVLPLGVATVEHGPHLKLDNNERLARYLASRVQSAAAVVLTPPMTYHFSPAFLEYPGSTSVTLRTAVNMTIEIIQSLARYGPRRFYVLNTSIATLRPLQLAATTLADTGILLDYTNPDRYVAGASVQLDQPQVRVTHADEIETSIMLYVDPSAVDMTKAVREYGTGAGPMTRRRDAAGVYSASGVLGDPTIATREKGRAIVEALVAGALQDIEKVRRASLPEPRNSTIAVTPGSMRPTGQDAETIMENGCTAGQERAIRDVGSQFSFRWRQMSATAISLLFSEGGDIRHPDGMIERGRNVILANRLELFGRREYRGSVHPVALNDIRCLNSGTAIADGKWELRLADSPEADRGNKVPPPAFGGWCTLVLTNTSGTWLIEAWRYTVDPPSGTPPPTTLKTPGFIGRGQPR